MEWTQEYNTLSTSIYSTFQDLANILKGENGNAEDVQALIPDIVRLVEDPDVKKEIFFDEISMSLGDDQSNDPTIRSGKKDIGGIAYPVIRVNDYVFQAKSIEHMQISCSGFLPTITLKIRSIESNVLNKNMPKDGDMISVYMRTSTSALEYVRCDFIITSVSSKSVSSNPEIVSTGLSMSGKLFIPKFNATKLNTFGYIGTTREVLRHIAEDFKIGFAYNDEENTNDLQNWINCNRTIPQFVGELISHAWKDNVSFFKTWIDLYYNLVYVNVNKYFNSPESNSELDLTFMTNVISTMGGSQHSIDPTDTGGMVKMFTTAREYRGTPFFIKKWTPHNNSTNVSFNVGYSTSVCSFIHNQGILNEQEENEFSMLESIPSYNKEKTKSEMILRGRSSYDPDLNPESDMETVNYDFVNTYVKKEWYGVMYMKNDDETDTTSNSTWSGNVHKNYALAPYHNKINNAELNKLYITIECEGLNLQVQRGEYVPVLITFRNEADYLMNNSMNDVVQGATLKANRMYSGYYFVDSVEYKYKYSSTESFSDFTTIYTLRRREWPTPEKIEVDETENQEKLPQEEVDNELIG